MIVVSTVHARGPGDPFGTGFRIVKEVRSAAVSPQSATCPEPAASWLRVAGRPVVDK